MIIERKAIRAVVLTPEREVLLLDVHPPRRTPFWVTPGGGLEPGESSEQGLRRELAEELGLVEFQIGPLLSLRQHAFSWGGNTVHQRDEIYLVEHPRFEPHMSDLVEAKTVRGFRWWTLAELRDTQEEIAPRTLLQIVQRYLDEGAPRGEILLEVDAP